MKGTGDGKALLTKGLPPFPRMRLQRFCVRNGYNRNIIRILKFGRFSAQALLVPQAPYFLAAHIHPSIRPIRTQTARRLLFFFFLIAVPLCISHLSLPHSHTHTLTHSHITLLQLLFHSTGLHSSRHSLPNISGS
jgi:hypothetical protein